MITTVLDLNVFVSSLVTECPREYKANTHQVFLNEDPSQRVRPLSSYL